jgi:UDP-GlcNAc:undecaprenyl-phosphate GlcNAc-1-phosphate transferase
VYSIIFLSVVSFCACLLLTPLVRGWSERNGFYDRPNSGRKRHPLPRPRTGGMAIVLSYVAAVGIFLVSPLNATDRVDVPFGIGLVPSVTVVFTIGLLDDLVGLPAWVKLLGQVMAFLLAYAGGVHVADFGGYWAGGWATLPITVAWLVACSNAFNLIDGLDGLATGVGLFAAFTTLAAALVHHNAALALATAPLVGALLAFLRYNFNPASIFLGDSGSLTLGFLLGCFGALWSQKSATLLGMTAPMMALSVPLVDTGTSVVRRFVRRQPIFTPDRNHLHHRLLDRGLTARQVALVLYGVCGLGAAFSLLETWPQNRFDGLLVVAFCMAVYVGVQLVGYPEFNTARHLIRSGAFRHIVDARLIADSFERNLAAAHTPEQYWSLLCEVGEELGCHPVRLSLNGRIFEDSNDASGPQHRCTLSIPLEEDGYVTLAFPAEFSVRDAAAISAVAQILQQSRVRHPAAPGLAPAVGDSRRSSTEIVGTLEPVR